MFFWPFIVLPEPAKLHLTNLHASDRHSIGGSPFFLAVTIRIFALTIRLRWEKNGFIDNIHEYLRTLQYHPQNESHEQQAITASGLEIVVNLVELKHYCKTGMTFLKKKRTIRKLLKKFFF